MLVYEYQEELYGRKKGNGRQYGKIVKVMQVLSFL